MDTSDFALSKIVPPILEYLESNTDLAFTELINFPDETYAYNITGYVYSEYSVEDAEKVSWYERTTTGVMYFTTEGWIATKYVPGLAKQKETTVHSGDYLDPDGLQRLMTALQAAFPF